MTTLEQVEKLRERANVSFEEAKAALDEAGGDILDALILLERQGKTDSPAAGGFYSGESATEEEGGGSSCKRAHRGNAEGFKKVMRGIGSLLLRAVNAGNTNHIDATRHGNVILSCPVTVFVLLLIVAFWGIVPLIIVSLFFNWRYVLRGPDLGRESINSVISSAEDAVEELKNSVINNKKASAEEDKNENTESL